MLMMLIAFFVILLIARFVFKITAFGLRLAIWIVLILCIASWLTSGTFTIGG